MWIIELAAGAWLGKTFVGMCFEALDAHCAMKRGQANVAALQAKLKCDSPSF